MTSHYHIIVNYFADMIVNSLAKNLDIEPSTEETSDNDNEEIELVEKAVGELVEKGGKNDDEMIGKLANDDTPQNETEENN